MHHPSNDWLTALQACRESNTACVLVTVIATQGSLPRGAGSKMLVTANNSVGSVGGSSIELEAIGYARTQLQQRARAPSTRVIQRQEPADTHCGGQATLLFEPFQPSNFNILLFGAGHVGQALVHVLAPTPCRVLWIDSRTDVWPEAVPEHIHLRVSTTPEAEVDRAPAHSYFVLMSHSHEQDFRIGKAILARTDVSFFGMIGSARKRRQFEQRMIAAGIDAETLRQRLICPLGLAEIKGRQPSEIAIAIAAQLLQVRDQLSD